MSEIGRLSILLAFLCSCFAVVSIALGLRTGMAGPLKSGRRAVWVVCGLTLLAIIVLERALLARDFSFRYVSEHTSLDLPPMYAFSSLWAGQEGSLLLWLFILSAYGAAFLWSYRKRLDPFYDAVAMVVAGVMVFFTSMFLHGGWLHLVGNMWFLWIFGDNVEDVLGSARFVFFYLACGLAAGFTHFILDPSSAVPTIGASGAIAGVLGGYMVLFPRARVLTLVPLGFFLQVMELPAALMIGLWFLVQLASALLTEGMQSGGVAWWAHVGGFVAGLALVGLLRRRSVMV